MEGSGRIRNNFSGTRGGVSPTNLARVGEAFVKLVVAPGARVARPAETLKTSV